VVRFEFSVDIDKPVHQVWEYLIDPDNVPEWQASALSSHQISDGEMGVGTHLQDERGLRPGTKMGPRHFSWFKTVVGDYFCKKSAREAVFTPPNAKGQPSGTGLSR